MSVQRPSHLWSSRNVNESLKRMGVHAKVRGVGFEPLVYWRCLPQTSSFFSLNIRSTVGLCLSECRSHDFSGFGYRKPAIHANQQRREIAMVTQRIKELKQKERNNFLRPILQLISYHDSKVIPMTATTKSDP